MKTFYSIIDDLFVPFIYFYENDRLLRTGWLTSRVCLSQLVFSAQMKRWNSFEKQVINFFNGKLITFNINLDYSHYTDFEKKVLGALSEIPFGSRMTYSEMALKINSKCTASRAVGQACRKNPYPLIIPCHRVISKSGLGGYHGSQGVFIKEILLDFERKAKKKR